MPLFHFFLQFKYCFYYFCFEIPINDSKLTKLTQKDKKVSSILFVKMCICEYNHSSILLWDFETYRCKSSEYHVKIVRYDFTRVLKYKQIEIAECKDLMAESLHDEWTQKCPANRVHTHAKITICLGRNTMAGTCSILRVNNRVR